MPRTSAKVRHLISLDNLATSEIVSLLGRASELSDRWARRQMPQSLAGKRVALIVDDSGWRNTTAFDLGVQSMGGLCVHTPIRLHHRGEDIGDLGRYLSNWFDLIVSRTVQLEALRTLASAATIPVVNARTHHNHPCEILGDLAFYWRSHGTIDAIKVAVVSPQTNILRSWIEASRVLPIKVVQVFSAKWHITDFAPGNFSVSDDMGELVEADILVTDEWPENGTAAELSEYQITAARLDRLKPSLEFIPCPPVSRGKEVSEDVMVHRNCRAIEAKAFLLHAQNALLEWVLAADDTSTLPRPSPARSL